ncbi:ABC transporter permease [Halomarina oriensis]|uniref:ABC transporter permease subunit n=1 Tax=Halomarina oriensis TaxID=671145 RepID=A0A6B0GQ15_9EURY|nr:ABC transporter permease [Halomarina oriensis]MWG34753.1 ABC transporter permease subunit [Halomarina oriensis]
MSRWSYFARRLVLAVPVLLFSMSIAFVILRMGPIDPVSAIVGTQNDPAYRQAVARSIGLIDAQGNPIPLWEQYFAFMRDLLTFDLGRSWVISRGTSVSELIASRAPRTIWLGFWSVLVALLVGIPLGFYAGLNPNTFSDYTASFGGIIWRAMPNFWLGIIISSLLVASAQLTGGAFNWADWIVETSGGGVTAPPLTDLTDPENLAIAIKQILPAALVLGSSSMGNEMRIGRTAVLETVNSNYVETARAKGLPERVIVWKHIFRNALIPLVPVITAEAFLLIGGSVVVEAIFAINGLGKLFFDAAIQGDLPLAGSLLYIFVLITLSINILQDFLYTIIDPRIGYD